MKFLAVLFIFQIIVNCYGDSGKFFYYNNDELIENDECTYGENQIGYCRKLEDCKNEYDKYKMKSGSLKVCKFEKILRENLVCCPITRFETLNKQQVDFTDYEVCMGQFVEVRKGLRNPEDIYDALEANKTKLTKEHCDNINNYKWNIGHRSYHVANDKGIFYLEYGVRDGKSDCVEYPDGSFRLGGTALPFLGNSVLKGERTNMAAIGWIQENNIITFNCGGSILTPRWIISAAHCKFFNRKMADVVRVGDRFLKSSQDDEDAQQLRIESFIHHPNYRSDTKYNDIAMVKTVKNIIFTEFITHACIPKINYKDGWVEWKTFDRLGVAGFGQTENGTNGNVLLEIEAYEFDREECKKIYENLNELPQGILPTQICIQSPKVLGRRPDTCYGDSGSPLQFLKEYDVKDKDYERTFMKTTYKIPLIVGIVSFAIGKDCGHEFPSIYTHVPYFKDWIRSVIQSN